MTGMDGMGAIGTPRLPISRAFVSTVLQLLAAGARQMKTKGSVTTDMWEDQISKRLDQEMEGLHRGSESDIVTWAMRPSTVNPNNPDGTTEVDFRFHWNQFPRDQRRYLAAEAKKLRGKGPSMAGEYVEQGVLRFVNGRYARGHDHAIMIGYVVAGPLNNAVTSVKDAMDRRKSETGQCSELAVDGTLCSHPDTHTSSHLQQGAASPFTMVHLFFDLD